MSTVTNAPSHTLPSTGRSARARTRAVAVIGGTAAALVAWAIVTPLATLSVHSGSGTGHVGVGSVAAAALAAGIGGWGLLAALERTTVSARTTWTGIALVVLAASLTGPLTAGIGGATKAALVCIHLAAAGVLIPALSRTAGRR